MRVLFCASEVSPFAKTGGLADVTGSLPVSLRKLGCDVRIFMPFYSMIPDRESYKPIGLETVIPAGVHDYRVYFREGRTETGIPIYFLEKEEFYDRSFLYGTPVRGEYDDNAERFLIFSKSAYQLCKLLDWYPDIFHLHDWQTGLIAAYMRLGWHLDTNLSKSGTVFTIHNIAYQGLFPLGIFPLTLLPPSALAIDGIEFWGQVSFLKAGLVYSDFLTTVSPTYSREIQTPAFGFGLEGLLKERSDTLAGILNGIDTVAWDPEKDPLIPANFNARDLSGKKACKDELCRRAGFPLQSSGRPLLGMIGRMATQKGFDLLEKILPELMKLQVNLVILGTGDAAVEKSLRKAAKIFPDRLKLVFEFDEALSHLIEAGSDIFLMPSRYEPCGLNQMFSLRYGTIPVVHATGGLDDSVVDAVRHPNSGTGFKFNKYKPEAFLEAVRSALDTMKEKDRWIAIQKRAMAQDFSWDRSAGEYIAIYEEVLSKRAVAAV